MSALADLAVDPEVVGLFNRPDYYEVLARLRQEAPLYEYAPHSWTVARYEDVRAISRNPAGFRSGGGVLMNDPKRQGAELPGSILHMDPPEHGAWRKIASRWFTPRGVGTLEPQVRAAARTVLDSLEPGEEIDAVERIAAPIPVLVIAELLGIGDADQGEFRRWSDVCIEGADNPDADGATGDDGTDPALANMIAVGELLAFLTDHAVSRRSRPRDDLLSELVSATVDDGGSERPLRDDEIVMYCLSLLVAGNETTRHLISGAIAALGDHPDQRATLAAAGEADLTVAVEECLRWVTPIQAFARTATAPTEVGGQAIDAGDWLVLLYASANRDEEVYGTTADRFDSARPANPAHVAFGFGEHLCLGASLARLEGRVVFLDEFLRRFPTYEIAGPTTWTPSTLVRGAARLPVRLP